jgi:hypothetical protein
MTERFGDALIAAGECYANIDDALPFAAEDVLEDAAPRRAVVASYAAGQG